MNKKEYLEEFNYLSFTAGMNQRYHQYEWTRYSRIDKQIRASVGIISIFGLILSLLTLNMQTLTLNILSIIIATIALGIAMILNIYPSGQKANYHQSLLEKWSYIWEDVESQKIAVQLSKSNEIPSEVSVRLRELYSKVNQINGTENSPNKELLDKCYEEENKARTGFRTQEELDEARAKSVSIRK